MSRRSGRWTVIALAALLATGCAVVPVSRDFDDDYGAAVTVAPAVVLPPVLFWSFGYHWHGGGHRYGHPRWRGHGEGRGHRWGYGRGWRGHGWHHRR